MNRVMIAFIHFVFITLLHSTDAASLPFEDVPDVDEETQARWERDTDYGRGIGGPVAAVTPDDKTNHNAARGNRTVNECASISLHSENENTSMVIKNGRCKFIKKPSRVLHVLADMDIATNKYQKMVICSNQVQCTNLCLIEQCTYFVHYIREPRLQLAFLYKLDERTLKGSNYEYAKYFDSYIQDCRGEASSPSTDSSSTIPPRRKNVHFTLSRQADQSQRGSLRRQRRFNAYEIIMKLDFPSNVLPSSPAHTFVDRSNFKQYAQSFKKTYSDHEQSFRSNVYQSNLKRIDELNERIMKSSSTDAAKYGITKFADMTHDEFVRGYTGALPDTERKPDRVTVSTEKLEHGAKDRPVKFDWRDLDGIVGPVRSQDNCGSCYAFTAVDMISIQNAIERRQRGKVLSAQYIVDCYAGSPGGMGCRGGQVGKVLRHTANGVKGVPLESCYRYQSVMGTCRKQSSCCVVQTIKWSQTLDATGPSEKDIIAGLLLWGPVVAVIDASEAWQFYNGTGIIKANQCSMRRQNHAVLLVGYNYAHGTPYYIVRNTWGEEWGEKGYAKLQAGTNACAVANTIVTTCAYDCDKVKNANQRLENVNRT